MAFPETGGARAPVPGRERLADLAITATLFAWSLYPYRDFDWGWHYRLGEHFVRHGRVYGADTFSWTMAGYVWANHGWLSDVLVYLVHAAGGFFALSLAGAALSVLAFRVAVRGLALPPLQAGAAALFFWYLNSGVAWQGLRSQMFGVLLVAILLRALRAESRPDGGGRAVLALPLLFLAWVNLHGSFALGLALLGGHTALRVIASRPGRGIPFPRRTVLLAGGCFAATLANPYFLRVHVEAFRHAGSPVLRHVKEWAPPDFPSPFAAVLLAYAACLAATFFARGRAAGAFAPLASLLLFVLALRSRRFAPLFAGGTLVYLAENLAHLAGRVSRSLNRLLLVPLVGAGAALVAFAFWQRFPAFRLDKGFRYDFVDYCALGPRCSERLTAHLLRNPPRGRGLNFYDWGGYLLGRGVPAKLFIDGRMTLWERGDGYRPMEDYLAMYLDGDIERFRRHDFDWFVVPTYSRFSETLKLGDEVRRWRIVYQDELATYAVRIR